MQKFPRALPLVLALVGVIGAIASMASVVPRIRPVEAVTLFATAFGAGACVAVTVMSLRGRR